MSLNHLENNRTSCNKYDGGTRSNAVNWDGVLSYEVIAHTTLILHMKTQERKFRNANLNKTKP